VLSLERQQNQKRLNDKLLLNISENTGLSVEKLNRLIKMLELDMKTKTCTRFLSTLTTHEPSSVVAGYYNYLVHANHQVHVEQSTKAKIRQFMRFVLEEAQANGGLYE